VNHQSVISYVSASLTILKDTTTVERFVAQKTEMSRSAPPIATTHGKVPHQIIFALPLRNDSKVRTGTVMFTASKPIEIEVFKLISGIKQFVLDQWKGLFVLFITSDI
jgi:hypothetical protein